ncbi:unnamed protein product [Adineta ricciae]|uniref:Uncharacterized protein n=1 Tax=Adineta ricciae TaxID=249248 RepID=A0A815GK15_ADIRI|nr:unnamed protein product [Adineta ricciae]CAF1339575.1 unnamed protein product [Adineta ricciae]
MVGIPQPFSIAESSAWSRFPGEPAFNPSLAEPLTDFPTVNNSNLPPSAIPTISSVAPPVPQPPSIPFPSIQQVNGQLGSVISTDSGTMQTGPLFNQMQMPFAPNPTQIMQNEFNNKRLAQLEEENAKRQTTIMNIQQMGEQVLQSQMDIQEQILQYRLMLKQCIQSLDHQSFILSGQSDEIALVRAKMCQFEYLIDALRKSKEENQQSQNNLPDPNFLCSQPQLPIRTPSMTPFLLGGVTRVRSSKFQPFNPRRRSPEPRPTTFNESQNANSTTSNLNVNTPSISRPADNINP